MDLDDGQRPNRGIGVFARRTETGLRIIFDTLERVGDDTPPKWKLWSFVTHDELDPDRFLKHRLTTQEYAAIGQTVIACLVGSWKEEEEPTD